MSLESFDDFIKSFRSTGGRILPDPSFEVPERFNFARDVLDRLASNPEALALWWVGREGAERKVTFTEVAEQSRRAASVVQKLRKLVRSGSVSKAQHDINKIIRNTLLLFEYEIKKEKIDLKFHPLNSLEELYVDEIHIQQIMVNLVKNSIDAISQSGASQGRIDIRIEKVASEVHVSVTDNGPGVPEIHRQQLFDSFFTTKPRGVGLGLSICRTIAAAHGGNLMYTDDTQGGSTFTLSLPLELIG